MEWKSCPTVEEPSMSPLPGQGDDDVDQIETPEASGSSEASFVVCEICDGYLKDYEQLNAHLECMHQIQLGALMMYMRPPFHCQKCPDRFFSNIGLKRHLLGSHGLVSLGMIDAAESGRDGGSCPICKRMFERQLLNHMTEEHNMTLTLVHLTYKCSKCLVKFAKYSLLECHVHSVHSGVGVRYKVDFESWVQKVSTENVSASLTDYEKGDKEQDEKQKSDERESEEEENAELIDGSTSRPNITDLDSWLRQKAAEHGDDSMTEDEEDGEYHRENNKEEEGCEGDGEESLEVEDEEDNVEEDDEMNNGGKEDYFEEDENKEEDYDDYEEDGDDEVESYEGDDGEEEEYIEDNDCEDDEMNDGEEEEDGEDGEDDEMNDGEDFEEDDEEEDEMDAGEESVEEKNESKDQDFIFF